MKTLTLALALALAGCAKKSTPAAAPVPEAAPMPAAVEAEPMADVAADDCSLEVMLECAEGEQDGCTVMDDDGAPITLGHICTNAKKAGVPCDQEIARTCEDGYVDACSTTPAKALTHLCVKL